MSILCPTCLTENGNDAKNCVICGSTLQQKSIKSTSILCSACSTENDISAQLCVSCGLDLQETAPPPLYLPPGTLLKKGTYQLEKVVGEGGFGITYQAIAVNTGELLAIKELLPERSARQGSSLIWMSSISPAAKREQINKFKNEAETISRCTHRNIVRVYEAFEENNTAYIVMNFVTGRTLETIFKQKGRLSENILKPYFRQISEALRVIHANYTLHRDVKPGNIIIDDTDNAILVDFGSAREFIADKTGRMTRVLSPGYAPPEQYSSSGRFTPSTDFYALCASLYELLTGELPVSALDRLQEDTLKSPRLIVPEVSQLMEQIIITGMRLRAEDRFQSADELINAFDGKYISPSLGRSRSLAKENRLPEAVQAYRTVLKVEPDNGDAAVELAMVQMHLDDVEAEAAAQVAIRLRPQDSRGYGVLGLVACRQGKWVEAIRHLQLAVTFSPQTAWIYSNLAWALGKSGKWQQAEVYLNRALQLEAESPFTLGLQAWLAAQQKNWKIAIRTASRSIINAKQVPPAHSRILQQWLYPCKVLALIEAVANPQAEDIERAIQRFVEDCPDISSSHGFKGWWWATKERWRDALSSFEIASSYFPVPEWIPLNQGIVEERLGNLQGAIQVYETCLQQFQPSLSLPLLRIGTLYGQMGQWEKARSYLERAVREQPDSAEAYHNLGWVLLNIKNSEGAIENVREVRRVYQKAVELYVQQNCTTLSDQISSAFRDAGIEL